MSTLDVEILDRRRADAGWTVKDCAEAIGVSYPRLWRFLRPTLEPDEVERLNALLDVQERHYIRSA